MTPDTTATSFTEEGCIPARAPYFNHQPISLISHLLAIRVVSAHPLKVVSEGK
jgi:hypothetical protein